ncbi:unknown [Prevotella sp. CAG:485]|nr:unknown [Prevotella sp. CAG:485]
MSNVPAVMKADREGAAGVRTTDIAPSGLYPVPAFATDSLVQLYTVPVIYKVPCTRYNVSRSFYVRSIPGLTWDIPSVLTLTDSLVNVRDVLLQGDYSLTANYGTFSRVIPMVMNFDHTNGVDNLYDSDNELQIMPGQIVVPAGQYAVFNLAGQTIATGRTAHPTAIQLPAGIYLIRYGRHAKKVLVP